MRGTNSLWSISPAWRWTLSLTLLATALVVLSAPWQHKIPSLGQAQYTPPAPIQGTGMSAIPRQSPLDPAFDTPISVPTATFTSDTELHVIGVYEAALPNGEREKPWWSNCTALGDDPTAMMACHQKYSDQHPIRTITAYLNQTTSPVVLTLMAYEPVRWKIVARPAADLRKVILAGYHGQDIEGISESIPVDVHSYESSPCLNCTRQPDYFYAYKQDDPEFATAMLKLKALTGLSPTSFQGAYKSEHFTIASGHMDTTRAPLLNQPEQYKGKTFSNHLTIAQTTLLLPDGVWHGLGHVQTPSKRGEDHYLLLSRNTKNQLTDLLAIRLQRVKDDQGFSQYQACSQLADYKKHVQSNQALGQQLCYWSNHVATPWQQPIFKFAANRLAALRTALPDSAISTGFHKADSSMSLTTLYYTFPDSQIGSSAPKDWSMNPWNPALINNFPENAHFLNQRLEWAADWFQIFSATQHTPALASESHN